MSLELLRLVQDWMIFIGEAVEAMLWSQGYSIKAWYFSTFYDVVGTVKLASTYSVVATANELYWLSASNFGAL